MTADENTRKALEQVKEMLRPFKEREARAATRMASESKRCWWFALSGLRSPVDEFTFVEDLANFRRVTDAPGEVELAAALKHRSLFGAIGRYSASISFEIGIDRDWATDDKDAFALAWAIVRLIRVKSGIDFLVPAVADHSWSSIAAIKDGRCDARLLEDIPNTRPLAASMDLRAPDLFWVSENLEASLKLGQQANFDLAVDALATHHHEASKRMMAANIWTGIEALFGVQHEVRFRLAVTISRATGT